MTAQKNEKVTGGPASSNQERQYFLDAYRLQLDIWKVQNDNHFRRVQILMMAVQAALFAAALKVVDLEGEPWPQLLVLAVLAGLGLFSALNWIALNDRQSQYMEFCRRTLRNLERRLTVLGVPLQYFTLEANVFSLPEIMPPVVHSSSGTIIKKEKDRRVALFTWSGERYPDTDTQKKRVHESAKVAGGMITFERRLACSISVVWILVIIGIIAATGCCLSGCRLRLCGIFICAAEWLIL